MSLFRAKELLALFVCAAFLRLFCLPDDRHRWEGHEAAYLTCLGGECSGADDGQNVALMRGLARVVGVVSQEPQALQFVAILIGWLCLLAVMAWVVRTVDLAAAFCVGALLCVWGEHLAWSGAYYQVLLPHLLIWSALAVWTYSKLWSAPVGALLMALGLACRVELIAIAILAPLWVGKRAKTKVWIGCWSCGLLLGAGLNPAVGGQSTVVESALPFVGEAWLAQVFWLDFAGPWAYPPVVLLLVYGSWQLWPKRSRVVVAVWLTALMTHITGAAFVDWGYRHGLSVGFAFAILLAIAVRDGLREAGLRRAVAILMLHSALVVLLFDAKGLYDRYYAMDGMAVEPRGDMWPKLTDDSAFAGCRFLSEEPPVGGQPMPSHWLVDVNDGCWLWGEEFWHHIWTSRALAARGVRMHRLYNLEPVGVRRWPQDPGRPHRWVYRVDARR